MTAEFKKIKVAYFYTIFRNAAMARWVKNITDNIDQSKYAVSFVGLKIEESFTKEISNDICVVNLSNPYVPTALFKLIVYFRKERPDMGGVVVNSPRADGGRSEILMETVEVCFSESGRWQMIPAFVAEKLEELAGIELVVLDGGRSACF